MLDQVAQRELGPLDTATVRSVKKRVKKKKVACDKDSSSPKVSGEEESIKLNAEPKAKLPLLGKRKIWGTMKQSSAGAVCRTITQVTSLVDGDINVKRKYRSRGKETRWWHVVSGDEATLTTLKSEWERVKQQLGWKILPCLAFADSQLASANTQPNSRSTVNDPQLAQPNSQSTVSDLQPAQSNSQSAVNNIQTRPSSD